MNKKTSIFIRKIVYFSIFSVVLFSCQKQKPDSTKELITNVGPTAGEKSTEGTGTGNPGPVGNNCRIDEIQTYDNKTGNFAKSSTDAITYSADGRITKEDITIERLMGTMKSTIEYEYPSGKYIVKQKAGDGTLLTDSEYKLDQLGRIVQFLKVDNFGERKIDYEYSLAGYLSRTTVYNFQNLNGTKTELTKIITIFTYENGNLIRTEETSYSEGVRDDFPPIIVDYSYDLKADFQLLSGYNFINQVEVLGFPLFYYDNKATLLGKMSANRLLKKTSQQIYYDQGVQKTYNLVVDYTYTLDDQNRIVTAKETAAYRSGTQIKEYKYHYVCQ